MVWKGRRLPGNWKSLRLKVFRRDDYRCRQCELREGDTYPDGELVRIECDHIGDPDDHSLDNLQTMCSRCHRRRTSSQGAAARQAMINATRARYRREEAHPGLLPEGSKLRFPKRVM